MSPRLAKTIDENVNRVSFIAGRNGISRRQFLPIGNACPAPHRIFPPDTAGSTWHAGCCQRKAQSSG
jgi:hypothetical protein